MSIDKQFIGCLDFAEVRAYQERLHEKRRLGLVGDGVIYCEHRPTLSLGKRASDADWEQALLLAHDLGSACVRANRGGLTTFHGPGQLVVYPVISLRERRMGMRRFVGVFLSAMADAICSYGVQVKANTETPGLWLSCDPSAKLGFVGLQCLCGITNHGFSINLNCDLSPFSQFLPCGQSGIRVTSVSECLGRAVDVEEVACRVHEHLDIAWSAGS